MPKQSRTYGEVALALATTLVVSIATAFAQPRPLYSDPSAPLETRVDDLMARLTQSEKLDLLATHAYVNECLPGAGVPRLGIPSLSSANAAQGIGGGKCTNYPMEVNMASTWDPDLIHRDAVSLGREAHDMGRQLIYAPLINIQRTPQSGRFFENFSEDPYMVSRFATAYITGMQSQGIACCPKHFIGNDQENGRHGFSSEIDERTLREVYLRPFHAALVDAHAWSIMTAFNKLNGSWMSTNPAMVHGVLDTEYGFDGVAIGDWGSLYDAALSLNAGIDQEIAAPVAFTPAKIAAAITAGTLTQATVDDAVRRNVRLMIRTHLADVPLTEVTTDPKTCMPVPLPGKTLPVVETPADQALALKTAVEGIVLLKNDRGILPLDRSKIKSIAVIGPNAKDTQLGGRWSGDMTPFYFVNVLDGITAKAGLGTTVAFAQGCARTGDTPQATIDDAAALAAKSDVAIVVVGTDKDYEGEELDPPNIYLPGAQDKLIQAVAAANKNTIVVLNNGTPLLMDHWLSSVPAIVEAWYPGQETGNAVAEILFGDINPSGHLACTIAAHREDYSDWPNYPQTGDGKIQYSEGVFVGYRHFDKANIAPLYPFGYGLSYTNFTMGRLKLPTDVKRGEGAVAHISVTNTGSRAGDEVVQLYVRPLNPLIDRPVRELKGFERVSLKRGETKQVAIPIASDAFDYWDTATHAWKCDPGVYAIDIGDSSRNILSSAKIEVR